MTDVQELQELQGVAIDAAQAAAKILLEAGEVQPEVLATKSSDTDLVTEFDRRAEQAVVDVLAAARPADGIIGEEGARQDSSTGISWVVDPLDGTTNFTYGIPSFAVSVAVVVDSSPSVGVVLDPSRDELFTAATGLGSSLNGAAIRCGDRNDLSMALIGTGFNYSSSMRGYQAKALAGILPNIRDIRRSGVTSLDLCWVACGRLDAFFEAGLGLWDFSAGAVIAAEAGAKVTNAEGGAASSDFTVASNPLLHPQLCALLDRTGATDV